MPNENAAPVFPSGLLGNNIVQGLGYVAYAIGLLVIDKNMSGAYQNVLKAIVSFTGANLAGQLASDLHKLAGPTASDAKKS